MIDPETLAAFPLCRGLAQPELRRVAALLRPVSRPPGAVLMQMEQPGEAVYLLRAGTLQVVADQPDGESVILAILGPGALVGEMGVVQRGGRSATVIAMERCDLLWMHCDDFWRCLDELPALARNLTAILAQRLRLANAQIQSLAIEDVACRVARTLLTFVEELGRPAPAGAVQIPFRLTQGDLARLVGAARPTVNRILGELRAAGVIAVDARQRITVCSAAALQCRCRHLVPTLASRHATRV